MDLVKWFLRDSDYILGLAGTTVAVDSEKLLDKSAIAVINLAWDRSLLIMLSCLALSPTFKMHLPMLPKSATGMWGHHHQHCNFPHARTHCQIRPQLDATTWKYKNTPTLSNLATNELSLNRDVCRAKSEDCGRSRMVESRTDSQYVASAAFYRPVRLSFRCLVF
jgi:hypothetical protein